MDDVKHEMPPRLRVKPASDYIGVSHRSLASRDWRKKRNIPAIKIGRAVVFDRDALDRWLAKHTE